MSQRLFGLNKIGLFCDAIKAGIEKRKSEQVKVITLTLRLAPLDAKLASAIDNGIGEDSNVRASLFKLDHPDVKPHLDRVNFSLGCPRQNLTIYASPDTEEARLTLSQVKIAGTYARTQKDRNGYDFVFRASYGPFGAAELEFVHDWFRSQRFVDFEESEPLMEFEEDDAEEENEPGQVVDGRVAKPMWDDDDQPAAAAAAADTPAPRKRKAKATKKAKPATERSNRRLHSHQSKKGSKKR